MAKCELGKGGRGLAKMWEELVEGGKEGRRDGNSVSFP